MFTDNFSFCFICFFNIRDVRWVDKSSKQHWVNQKCWLGGMGLWEPYAHHRVTEPVGSQTASSKAVLWPMFTSYFTRRSTSHDDLHALRWLSKFLVAATRLYTLPCRYVRPSVTFLNCERFLLYCSCPTVRDWIAVYPALFHLNILRNIEMWPSKVSFAQLCLD